MIKKKYQIIYADPPWPVKWQGDNRIGKKPLSYRTMTIVQLCKLSVKSISEDCSKLFLWTPNAFLPEALGVIGFWGFQYDKLWTWCKPTGAGGFPRNATEHIIEASRGALKSLNRHSKAMNNWFIASVRGHSVKPEKAREIIDYCYPDYSKIELFARPQSLLFPKRDGWDVWGNEVESDIELG